MPDHLTTLKVHVEKLNMVRTLVTATKTTDEVTEEDTSDMIVLAKQYSEYVRDELADDFPLTCKPPNYAMLLLLAFGEGGEKAVKEMHKTFEKWSKNYRETSDKLLEAGIVKSAISDKIVRNIRYV